MVRLRGLVLGLSSARLLGKGLNQTHSETRPNPFYRRQTEDKPRAQKGNLCLMVWRDAAPTLKAAPQPEDAPERPARGEIPGAMKILAASPTFQSKYDRLLA